MPAAEPGLANGQGESRFLEDKREFDKPVPISAEVLLDRERCISCTRCVRTSEEIAGDDFIEFLERGPGQYIGTAAGKPFNSYFSGNTVQVCPVGALTGAAYRFKSRPFDLVSTPSVCEHCAAGCHQRTDHRRGRVLRRLAGDEPLVNEEWNCDKGRWAFAYASQSDRLTTPLVRDEAGVLRPASWVAAYAAAARGLAAARDAVEGPSGVGVLTGGRLTLEDAYAYSKFTRVALNTNDIDMRARPHSAEEEQFLAARVAGRDIEVSYTDLEAAPAVLLAGFEPEEESPIVFLRLRKAARKTALAGVLRRRARHARPEKVNGTLLPTVPGAEPATLTALAAGGGSDDDIAQAAGLLAKPGAVILVGERLAEVPGALAAAVRLADASGAKLAWIPRRAGERGAIEAGAMPGLLPIGRWVGDPKARAEVALAWNKATLPSTPGRSTSALLAAAADGELGALVIAGVDPADLPDPAAALRALDQTPFIVSLELRASAVTDRADVVFPVAAVAEKAGTFVNWEGRGAHVQRGPERARRPHRPVRARRDRRRDGRSPGAAGRGRRSRRAGRPRRLEGRPPGGARGVLHAGGRRRPRHRRTGWRPGTSWSTRGGCRTASRTWPRPPGRWWRGSPPPPRPRRASRRRQGDRGVRAGSVTVPLAVTEKMADGVVWLPTNSPGSAVRADLGAGHGSRVTLRRAE